MMLVMLLVWIGLLGLAVWGVGTLLAARASVREETPLEILRRRYAGGEIDRDEFEQAQHALA